MTAAADDYEIVFQSFAFPLKNFVAQNPNFDPTQLTRITLVFDQSPAGVVILDDIGFRDPV